MAGANHTAGSSGPMAAAQQLLHLQWRAAVLPVTVLLYWLQYTSSAVVHALISCGLYTEGRHSQKQACLL